MKHGLLLFFNHPYPKVRLFLEEYYRKWFEEIHTLTPPEEHEGIAPPGVTYYYHGSFNFGGAFTYLAGRADLFRGVDWVSVVHDDVLLNPAYRAMIEQELAAGPDFLVPAAESLQDRLPHWSWTPRMVARTFCSYDEMLGDGQYQPLATLGELYRQSAASPGPATTYRFPLIDALRPNARGVVARKFMMRYRRRTADFGVPLWFSKADFFLVRAARWDEFCRRVGLLTRCGLFVEVAIPTAIRWMAGTRAEFAPEQLDWMEPWHPPNYLGVNRREDIAGYFAQYPQRIAIHPVKMSKLI